MAAAATTTTRVMMKTWVVVCINIIRMIIVVVVVFESPFSGSSCHAFLLKDESPHPLPLTLASSEEDAKEKALLRLIWMKQSQWLKPSAALSALQHQLLSTPTPVVHWRPFCLLCPHRLLLSQGYLVFTFLLLQVHLLLVPLTNSSSRRKLITKMLLIHV